MTYLPCFLFYSKTYHYQTTEQKNQNFFQIISLSKDLIKKKKVLLKIKKIFLCDLLQNF